MKRRKLIIIGIVCLVAVLAIGGYVYFKESSNSAATRYMDKLIPDQPGAVQRSDSAAPITTGVQQIMIGTRCNNYDIALNTLTAIKEVGYDAIELNDYMVQDTPFIVRLLTKLAGMPTGNGGKLDWHKLLKESGLAVSSLHSNLGTIEEDPQAVAALAKSYGTDVVVITGMYQFDYSDAAQVEDLARRLNAAGKALAEEGIHLLYHNHNCELQKVSKDKTAYDIIIENTEAEYVNFELDSYWMTDGGANVPALMEKLGSRLKYWHINDRACKQAGPYMTPILQQKAAELGYGNMDLEALAEIAVANGVECVILETHNNWIDNDPVKSLTVSAEFMKEHFPG